MTPGTHAPRVLVVDDDPAIRRGLAAELQAAGYETIEAADGREGLSRFDAEAPDLVLTDLAMPRQRRVRADRGRPKLAPGRRSSSSPSAAATATRSGLSISGPTTTSASRFRCRSFSPASGRTSGGRSTRRHASPLEFPGLTIDRERRLVAVEGREVRLTPTEFSILEFLASRAGKPVTIAQIIGRVWHGAPGTTPDVVRVHVGSLRRKIEPDPARPRFILTEPWVGYRFVAEPLR